MVKKITSRRELLSLASVWLYLTYVPSLASSFGYRLRSHDQFEVSPTSKFSVALNSRSECQDHEKWRVKHPIGSRSFTQWPSGHGLSISVPGIHIFPVGYGSPTIAMAEVFKPPPSPRWFYRKSSHPRMYLIVDFGSCSSTSQVDQGHNVGVRVVNPFVVKPMPLLM